MTKDSIFEMIRASTTQATVAHLGASSSVPYAGGHRPGSSSQGFACNVVSDFCGSPEVPCRSLWHARGD